MNIGTLLLLMLLVGLAMLAAQRTERRRRWLTMLLLLLPMTWILWRWAIFAGYPREFWIALGLAVALNAAYWLFYGRLNPPGSKGEIRVIGSDDELL